MPNPHPQCAICPFEWSERYCRKAGGKAPENCPSVRMKETLARAQAETTSEALLPFACEASRQEGEGYAGRDQGYATVTPCKPRIQEIIEFARRMHYKRLGLAFCVGVRFEAEKVHRLFESAGFEVVSVACKAGRVPKSELGLTRDEYVDPTCEVETMCNPVFQAEAVNDCEVDLNILMGLCVGHDSLFIMHAKAPVTVLAVKDRMLGHNPMAAVYQLDTYYRYLKDI
ncbi:DUF1847 domain-containing protein [uncultured Pseudodesulfovibrio sp.]|uniref:DUF1847 domain-containing protein n=1 Tax=uncultured Pseudodesulfovibrio sp. TaxID=2035858 RepID=UPI0029C72B25|nr:DUF1847 domain-containing protein [uncultured Pseudodesulfovibrio sp.]